MSIFLQSLSTFPLCAADPGRSVGGLPGVHPALGPALHLRLPHVPVPHPQAQVGSAC